MMRKLLFATVTGMALSAATQAGAATVTLTFPSGSSPWLSATNGSGTGVPSQYMWTTGDYITQTFTGTGLGSASSLTYSLALQDGLGNGSDEILSILVNGTQVDTQTITDCGYCFTDVSIGNSVSFAPIVGNGTYTLTIELTNTIPGGNGSIKFDNAGTFTLGGSVPEPASLALLGAGLAGLGLIRRRKVA